MTSLSLDQLKKGRKPVRANLTRTINAVDTILVQEKIDPLDLTALQKKLNRIAEELASYDNQVKEILLTDDEISTKDYTTETDSIDEYFTKFEIAVTKIERALSDESSRSVSSDINKSDSAGIKPKLPKLNIRKFTGEPLDWLTWWANFEPIHLDDDIRASDKFRYLSDAMTPKTRAADIVDSYPMSELNYPKAIAALESRYAKPNVLKQLYVRELLKLAMKKSKSEKIELTQHYDKLESHIRSLESLGITDEMTSAFLFPIVESSLPEPILIAWQRSTFYTEMDSNSEKTEISLLMEFLEREANAESQRKIVRDGFEKSNKTLSDSKPQQSQQVGNNVPKTTADLVNTTTTRIKCVFCENPHFSSDCRKSRFIPKEKKLEMLKTSKTCFKCLCPNHRSKDCTIAVQCEECSDRTHLRPLCPKFVPYQKLEVANNTPTDTKNKSAEKTPMFVASNSANTECRKDVLLKTLMVKLKGPKGELIVRLFFDEGSQLSYVTTDALKKIGTNPVQSEWSRNMLFSGVITEPRKVQSHEIEVCNVDGLFPTRLILCETPVICGIIPRVCTGLWMNELHQSGIELSDFNSSKNEETPIISIQIGSDYRDSLILSAPQHLSNGLSVTKTKFGWSISGPVPDTVQINTNCEIPTSLACYNQERSYQLWELDALGIRIDQNDDVDKLVEEIFESTVTRAEDGRYCVCLPWKESTDSLPTNRPTAEKRLRNLTRRLNSSSMFPEYDHIFSQWKKENIIEEVPEKETGVHFLPHRAVFKENSSTTPLRPVFDGSSKVGKNRSINDCLYKGPNLLDFLPSFLLRFCEKLIAFCADIRKAFLMIEVAEKDRDFLRFLWWLNNFLVVLRHCRLVFGLNCSPYLLNAILKRHFSQWIGDEDVLILLKISFYVDNLVNSVESIEIFENFKKKAILILGDAQMELREWCDSASKEKKCVKILGINWNLETDEISPAKIDILEVPRTRQKLSSVVQQIFDPLGIFAPAMLIPKLYIQESWHETKDWEELLSKELYEK